MHYSLEELRQVELACSALNGRYAGLMQGQPKAVLNLVAVQYLIQSRSMSRSLSREERSNKHLEDRILVAKLYNEQPNPKFIVTSDYRPMLAIPRIQRLYMKYSNAADGLGYWEADKRIYEWVIYSLYVAERGIAPVVVEIETLRSLLTTMRNQERVAVATDDAPKKLQKVDDSASSMSVQERKERAAFGTCYRCSAPKARAVRCEVCGYMPRGAK